ncbi:MAG TPA: hypothetical protein VFA26_00055 [Gemmataceae bacterium]|nr:hypothetical protein [Gemmataceae bacterium]
MLTCRICDVFISQETAALAAEIVGEGHETMCEACACALAEAAEAEAEGLAEAEAAE